MVNTKLIRQPSQSPSLLSSPLPLSPPPSFLSLLSLSSSHYPKFSNSLSPSLSSLSLTLAPPPPVSLPEPDTHRIFFTLPTPILNSQFVILCLRLSLLLYSLCSVLGLLFSREVFDCFCCCGGFGRCTNWVRLAKEFWLRWSTSLALFFLFHVLISSAIGRTEL